MTNIPPCFALLLEAWNERDPARRRALLDQSLSENIEFTDPNFKVKGIDAFDHMVAEFQQGAPSAICTRTSEIDLHHDRARYHWTVHVDANTSVDGFDAVALDGNNRIERVDGYFGPTIML